MDEIQNIAMDTYTKNINYFEKNHQDLYTKLKALESLLEDGRYPQKYDLEYKDDYFDIIELQTGNMLYNSNSERLSKKITKSINTKKNEHVFESFRNYIYTDKDVEILKNMKAEEKFSTTASIVHYYNSHIRRDSSMKNIFKFIFFGTGLGLHIKDLIKTYNFRVTLIIEDDIELFRLSLFTTPYYKIFDNTIVYFSISEKSDEFLNTFSAFYETAFALQHFLKFYAFSDQYTSKIKEVQKFILTRPENSYPHELLLKKNEKVLNRIIEKYKFINLEKKEQENFFKDKPILIIGAGPSLGKNIQWLQKNQNKFLIIAALASLKILQVNNILPDILMQIDEKEAETKYLLHRLENIDLFHSIPLIYSASVPSILLNKAKKENLYLFEDRTHYKLIKSHLQGASIGEIMYAFALLYNASNIYLLGLDFALADDGSTHSQGHHGSKKILQNELPNSTDSIDLDTELISVKGNYRESVQTTPRLSVSIPIFNKMTQRFKTKNQKVYNLNDGAFLENTIALQLKDVNISTNIKKSELRNSLFYILNQYSEDKLSEEENDLVVQRLQQIKILKDALQLFQDSPSSNSDIFLSNYLKLLNTILQEKHLELLQILIIYFLTTSSYIVDFFNTQGLKNQKKHVKKLKIEVVTQLKKVIDSYEDTLKKLST